MAKIRLKVKINKGKEGIPLEELAIISEDIHKFLSCVNADTEINVDNKNWIAKNFKSSNLNYIIENIDQVEEKSVNKYNNKLREIMSAQATMFENGASEDTIKQYAQITKHLKPNESIKFGLFTNGDYDSKEPNETFSLNEDTSLKIQEIQKEIIGFEQKDTIEYHGSVYGIIHAWHKESDKPFLKIRDLTTTSFIDCFYPEIEYQKIYDLFKKREFIVYVSGLIKADRLQRRIKSISANKFRIAPGYKEGDLQKFIGCAPDLTGDVSTKDYLERQSDHE